MNENSALYKFYYDGDFESIDVEPVLHCQLSVVKILIEISKLKYPGSKLDIKIRGTEKGSLAIDNYLELLTPIGLFIVDHKETVSTILKILSQLLSLKTLVKGKTPTFEKKEDGTVNVFVNVQDSPNAVVNISGVTSNLYQNSRVVNGAIEDIGKNLELISDDVESFSVIDEKTDTRIIDIPNTEFQALKDPNPILKSDTKEVIKDQVNLYVWKPDLMPEDGKKSVWVFNYKGRNIKATIKDQSLIDKVNNGIKFGQGDILVADLTIHMKHDKRVDTFVETKKFDVENVTDILFKAPGSQTSIE